MLISAKLAPVFDYAVLEDFWTTADGLGFHAIWNYDHFYGLGGLSPQEQPTLEGWTTLAAMAKVTTRARIGCLVTGVTYRHPAVLANMAATVDHICGGRLEFGLGAAWHEPEHAGYGIDFPPNAQRIDRLDEALTLIKLLWTEEKANFSGRYYTLNDAYCNPKPLQTPHPPIVVGGSGPKKTLRVVAKHADEWNGLAPTPEEWAKLNVILDEHCDAVGRNAKDIRRAVQLFVQPDVEGNAEQHLESLPAWEDAGVEHVVFSFYSPPSHALLEQMSPKR